MKIVHLNTLDTGGAATAAYRIHKGLQTAGVDSKMVVLHKTSDDASIIPLIASETGSQVTQELFKRWDGLLQNYPFRPKGLELFSDTYAPMDLSGCKEIIDADILHLHWVAGLFNPSDFFESFGGKPIVWTLHDMNPFTGGCHYAGKCVGFTKQCGNCPQLGSTDNDDLSRQNWELKEASYSNLNLTMVAPSRWLDGCIARSSLMGKFSLRTIPYGLPLEDFSDKPDPSLRQRLNLPAQAKIVLFGADNASNPRKGLSYLSHAISLLDRRKYNAENLCFVVFGGILRDTPKGFPYKIVSVGRVEKQAVLAKLYASADLFVLPSLEDNLPNTGIEAMACGTPVVAFDSGGIGDIVDHMQTGYLAETANPRQLAEGIDWVLRELEKSTPFRERCRSKVKNTFSFQKQAQAYLDLYSSLRNGIPSVKKRNTTASILPNRGPQSNATSAKPMPPKPGLSMRLSPIMLEQTEINNAPSSEGRGDRETIDISLILPTKDRTHGLEDVLQSIPAAMGDHTYEIILYTDRETSSRINAIISEHAISKIFYDHEVFGPGEGFSWSKLMNHAFAQASGTWIMYASDDIVFYPHCFSHALSSIDQTSEPSVGGITFLHRNTIETHQGAFEPFGYDSLNGDKAYINFGLIKADAFRKTHGFDENLKFFWADVDICMQLWLKGYRTVPSHCSLVDHHNFLESQQQENRQRLFAHDTIRFMEKWKSSDLFASQNPLEKVRYFLKAEQSALIVETLLSAGAGTNCESNVKQLRIVIDGVIFQLQHKRPLGIARVWCSLLPELVRSLPQARFTVLERRGFPVPFQDLSRHSVQPYVLGDESALDADDDMLSRVCLDLGADFFISTYFTRAPGVKNVPLVHDLIPEIMGYNMKSAEWRSKIRALESADGFAAVSQSTLNDLKLYYPHAVSLPLQKMHLGIGWPFGPVDESRIREFRSRYSLPENYLLMVGNRRQYKNGAAMWACMRSDSWDPEVFVLAVGGESQWTQEERLLVQAGKVRFLPRLGDEELAAAYAGAMALVCLSQYEGFGLPVLEAMAGGCPVITTDKGSLPEVAGEAALFVDAQNPSAIREAIDVVRQPRKREELVAKGFAQASCFSWQSAGSAMAALIRRIQNQPPALVSAIVSTYNSERFIRGCLEDLLAQTIADRLEIIVVDSASAQNEGLIVKEFQARCGRIKYERTAQRESVYSAWNRGIKLAKGTFVTNANTDDRHRPDAYEKMVALLEAEPKTALVYADVIKTRQPNQTMAACKPAGVLRWFDWKRERLLTKGCFIGPQPMWRRNIHDRFGFFDENMTVAADYEYWLRISQVFDFRRIPEPLGLYLERDDSVEHAHREKKRAEERMIHQRYAAAAAAGTILSFEPLERLRRGAQKGQREIMLQAVAEIDSISQAAAEGAGAGVKALCAELAAALAQDAVVTEDRIERFIHEASHIFLTRGAAPLAQAAQANNDREANRTFRECSQEGVPMMPFAEKIQQGVRCLLNSGHLESAQWMLDKWLTDYPGDAASHHERAILAHHQGDVNRAGMHFQKAAELGPGKALFQKSLGDFYHVALKNIDAALSQYQKVMVLTPDNLETLLITGHLCTAAHRFDEARNYYQKVLRLSPDQSDARQMLNQLSMKQAAQQPKETPESLYQSACRQVALGQHREATCILEQLIALDPGHALAHNDLGVLAFESGDKDKAQRLYEKACELAPYNGVFQKNLGDFYYLERGDAEKGLSRYVQALTLDPQDVESLMGTGRICMDLRRLDDARVFFDRTLEIDPWHVEAQQYLQKLNATDLAAGGATMTRDLFAVAQSQAVDGDPAGAIRTLEQLVTKEPSHAQAYNDLGVLYYEQGDKQQALRFYEQATRLAPHDDTFWKNLADFYFVEQGRTQEALRIYIRILESNREDVECLMAAGIICQSLGKNDDARSFLERVLEIDPWHAKAREDLDRISNERSGGYGNYITTLGQRRVGSA